MENQTEEKDVKKLYIIIGILSVLVLLLGGYIICDKFFSKDNSLNVSNVPDDEPTTSLFPEEESYTEVQLSAEQFKNLNQKLLDFHVGESYTLFPGYDTSNIKVGDNLYSTDCSKTEFAYNFVVNQLLGRIENQKYPVVDYYQETSDSYIINIDKVKTLAGQLFNQASVTCDAEPYDKDITQPKSIPGGGWAGYSLKAVSKHQNGNNYYLILHKYSDECFVNNDQDYCHALNDDPAKEGNYFKLKYYKDNSKEYIISLEYLQ